MSEKKREQMLNRLCTLLDDAELAARQEIIMHLMHSARRASRNRETKGATNYCIDALRQLRQARHTLRVAGVGTDKLMPVEYAIAELESLYDKVRADANAMLQASSCESQCFIRIAVFSATSAVIYAIGRLIF